MRQYLPPLYRTFLLVLALTTGIFAQGFKPANSVNAKDFLGKWQGSFQGKPFITLTLTGDAQKLSGTMSKGNVELNDAGELTKAEAIDGVNEIKNAQVNGNRLRLTTKTEDEDEIDSEMVLVRANEAELRLIVPPDVPKPKPWKLTRVPQS